MTDKLSRWLAQTSSLHEVPCSLLRIEVITLDLTASSGGISIINCPEDFKVSSILVSMPKTSVNTCLSIDKFHIGLHFIRISGNHLFV